MEWVTETEVWYALITFLNLLRLFYELSLVMPMLFKLVSELLSTLSVAFEIKLGISGNYCVIVSCINILSY